MKLLVIPALALALASCNGPSPIASTPAEIADQTKIDELAANGAEIGYTTASTLGNALSRAGAINRPRFQALDREAYGYLVTVRAAYQTGNSRTFAEALANLNLTISRIRDLEKE